MDEVVGPEHDEPKFSALMCVLIICGLTSIAICVQSPSVPVLTHSDDQPQESGHRLPIMNPAGFVVGGGRPIRVLLDSPSPSYVPNQDDLDDAQNDAPPNPPSPASPSGASLLPHTNFDSFPIHPRHDDSSDPADFSPTSSPSPLPSNTTSPLRPASSLVDLFANANCLSIPQLPISHSPHAVLAQLGQNSSSKIDLNSSQNLAEGRRGVVGAVRRLYRLREVPNLVRTCELFSFNEFLVSGQRLQVRSSIRRRVLAETGFHGLRPQGCVGELSTIL